MSFCSKCGKEMPDEAIFCPNCGFEKPGSQTESTKKEQVFVGKIKKCPNCGEQLSSDAVVCPACGFELGVDQISPELKAFKDSVSKLEAHALTNEKVALLLKSNVVNFIVPHTKGDIRDMLLFTETKIKNSATDPEMFQIWLDKHKSLVDDATLFFSKDVAFIEAFQKRQTECEAIAEKRKKSDEKILKDRKKQKFSIEKSRAPMSRKKAFLICAIIFIILMLLAAISEEDSKKGKNHDYGSKVSKECDLIADNYDEKKLSPDPANSAKLSYHKNSIQISKGDALLQRASQKIPSNG